MTIIHGFELLHEQEIREIKTTARLFRHRKTGAELLSLTAEDENKVFGITFRTPPPDSTGVAHILEHSVLCGSRKYPVKEPFVELLKGSLQTFLNAFTYPDKTCYPVASQNVQDFYNLIDVYLDAVFYPAITPPIFQQEGWHFELENREGNLSYKGVVYNEMKGAYSSPDNVLSEYSFQSLFPNTAYGFDSGGNPEKIPDLTYEQFHAFHQRYYHPSNARIYFYGDDDPKECLRLLSKVLEPFEPIAVDSRVSLQPPFPEPRRLNRPFMAGEDSDKDPRGMVTVNWALSETVPAENNFALRVLEYILLGMPGSPLRKALIESGLGEDLAGEGLGDELRQMTFSAGLKGVRMKDVERVEPLILRTLSDLAETGIDPKTRDAALNTIEFRLRENNAGSFPRGLLLMLRSLTTWLYDGDPLALLAFEKPLQEVREKALFEPFFFEKMIDRMLLSNSHRTTLVLEPDISLREREEAKEKARLENRQKAMKPEDLESIVKNAQALKRSQETPDSVEALASIPMLGLKDLDKKNRTIPLEVLEESESRLLLHDLFTQGIAYMDLGLDLRGLPFSYLPYVPLFGRALTEMGTEKEDFVALAQRISSATGGVRAHPFSSNKTDSKKSASWLFVSGKAMYSQLEALAEVCRDILLTVKLDNRERFRQMVMEEKARMEQKMIPAGHQMVNLRLKSHFSEAHRVSEQMGGVSYLFFLRDLAKAVENDWPAVLSTLQDIHRNLLNRKRMLCNITADQRGWTLLQPHLQSLLKSLPGGMEVGCRMSDVGYQMSEVGGRISEVGCRRSEVGGRTSDIGHRNPDPDWSWEQEATPEGLTIPSQVNYVGKGAAIYEAPYHFHGSALVITKYLRNGWLWDQVRVQGGAYGAFCMLDRLSGVLTLVSYRDPNLIKTLEVFDKSAQFLRTITLTKEELTKSVIGAIGDMDSYMLPDAKGFASMIRYLMGHTEDSRQQMRDEILETTEKHFRAMAPAFDLFKQNGLVKVLGSPSAMEAVEKEKPGWLKTVKVI